MFLVVFKGARTLDTGRRGHSGRRGEGHQGREYEGPGGNNDPHPVGGRRRHPTLATRKPRPGEAQRLAWGSEFEPWLPHAPEHGGTAPPGGNEGLPQSTLAPGTVAGRGAGTAPLSGAQLSFPAPHPPPFPGDTGRPGPALAGPWCLHHRARPQAGSPAAAFTRPSSGPLPPAWPLAPQATTCHAADRPRRTAE